MLKSLENTLVNQTSSIDYDPIDPGVVVFEG